MTNIFGNFFLYCIISNLYITMIYISSNLFLFGVKLDVVMMDVFGDVILL